MDVSDTKSPFESAVLVRSDTVKTFFGGISDMTLWRWMQNRDFPAPKKIAGRNYWDSSEVEQWRTDHAT